MYPQTKSDRPLFPQEDKWFKLRKQLDAQSYPSLTILGMNRSQLRQKINVGYRGARLTSISSVNPIFSSL